MPRLAGSRYHGDRRINLKVSDEFHAQLKARAALERVTLQELVERWLAEKLADARTTASLREETP